MYKTPTNSVDTHLTLNDKMLPMKTRRTHSDLCSLWQASALAKDLGVSINCACNWRKRNRIPTKHWLRFIEMLEKRHGVIVTLHQLIEEYENRRFDGGAYIPAYVNKEKETT